MPELEYNIQPHEPLTISFAPLQVSMAAYFMYASYPETPIEMKPVLGAVVRHVFNKHGEITGGETLMVIQYDMSGELCTTHEYESADGCLLVGIYPHKIQPEPPADDIETAAYIIRGRLERERAQREAKTSNPDNTPKD